MQRIVYRGIDQCQSNHGGKTVIRADTIDHVVGSHFISRVTDWLADSRGRVIGIARDNSKLSDSALRFI